MSMRRRELGSSPRRADPLLVPSHTSDQKRPSQAPNRPRTGRSNRRVECPSGDPLGPERYGELCGRVPVGRRPTGWCRPVRGTLHAQSTHTCAPKGDSAVDLSRAISRGVLVVSPRFLAEYVSACRALSHGARHARWLRERDARERPSVLGRAAPGRSALRVRDRRSLSNLDVERWGARMWDPGGSQGDHPRLLGH